MLQSSHAVAMVCMHCRETMKILCGQFASCTPSTVVHKESSLSLYSYCNWEWCHFSVYTIVEVDGNINFYKPLEGQLTYFLLVTKIVILFFVEMPIPCLLWITWILHGCLTAVGWTWRDLGKCGRAWLNLSETWVPHLLITDTLTITLIGQDTVLFSTI